MEDQIKVVFLNSGIPSLLKQSTSFFNVNLHSFIIGNQADFDVNPNESVPRGLITYNGDSASMKLNFFDDNKSMKVSLIIPEQHDNISIGNIIIYALDKGIPKPFVSIVLPKVVIKRNPSTEITDRNFKYPGNRLVIGITVRYVSETEIDTEYTINIVQPNFANLPFFGKDEHVPLVAENPYPQFVVNRMESLGNLPAFVTKDANSNNYFASPLFQNIASSKFGILNSFGADFHDGDRVIHAWGQLYTTNDGNFRGILGKMEYHDDTEDFVIIGGLSYEETV